MVLEVSDTVNKLMFWELVCISVWFISSHCNQRLVCRHEVFWFEKPEVNVHFETHETTIYLTTTYQNQFRGIRELLIYTGKLAQKYAAQ